ncbi:MAG: DUF4350 domain-containing protein [Gemmatimonadetes bacterium]|nr:DUF4350 domain-containing protein [Gemmatimonadota bacterium]
MSPVRLRTLLSTLVALVAPAALPAGSPGQQVPDTTFVPREIVSPWLRGEGPVLLLDEAHHNFHTVAGRYAAFARLASRTGFRVRPGRAPFTDSLLSGVRVLVIANALNAVNENGNWAAPNPSAFTPDEIAAVRRFVERGGGLLLVADHMPFGGAVEALGAAMGLQWLNGFAMDSARQGLFTATRASGLATHAVTTGVRPADRIDSLRIFTGSALRLLEPGEPLIALPPGMRVLMPDSAWAFSGRTQSVDGRGWLMGAARKVGRGRVVALGEAAMLSAQRQGPRQRPMGFNDPTAPQNAQFAFNVMRWLSGEFDAPASRR